jgi:hypothetical protein
LQALIPMYVYPTYLGSYWDVIEANPANVGYIIANPDTGPGTSVNSDYTTHIGNMRARGIKVLGYVDTDYAGIARSTVETTMTTWTSYYGTTFTPGYMPTAAPSRCSGAPSRRRSAAWSRHRSRDSQAGRSSPDLSL